jgi:hypothetical protein
MTLGRLGFLYALLSTSISAQNAPPSFTRESVLPAWGSHAQSLMPNDLVSIYGRHLAPADGCPNPPPPNGGNYPTEMCGTEVTVDGNGIRVYMKDRPSGRA